MLAIQEKVLLALVIVLALAVAETRPTFTTDYEVVKAEEGADLEVVCKAQGDRPINYTWYTEDESVISEDMRLPVYVSNNESISISTLILRSVNVTNGGLYMCTASNEHGSSSKLYQLEVTPSDKKENDTTTDPPSLRGVKVRNVTSTSVTFDIDIIGSVREARITAEYEEKQDNRTRYVRWSYGDEYTVKGLVPGGLYKFRVNAQLTPQTSHSITLHDVTLLPDKPEVIFRYLKGGQIKIEWTGKFEDIMRGTVDRHELSYYVVRIQGGQTWVPSDCAITVQIPSCTNRSYMIAGLSQNTYYEIQLRAHTAAGFGEPYTQKLFISSYD